MTEADVMFEEMCIDFHPIHKISFDLCGFGDQNSANICPCACRKRRLIRGENCPIQPPFCMPGFLACTQMYEFGQLGTWLSWLRKYTSPTADLLKIQRHPREEILSYCRSRKPNLPVANSSPFSKWLTILFFFSSPVKIRLSGQGYGFCG